MGFLASHLPALPSDQVHPSLRPAPPPIDPVLFPGSPSLLLYFISRPFLCKHKTAAALAYQGMTTKYMRLLQIKFN